MIHKIVLFLLASFGNVHKTENDVISTVLIIRYIKNPLRNNSLIGIVRRISVLSVELIPEGHSFGFGITSDAQVRVNFQVIHGLVCARFHSWPDHAVQQRVWSWRGVPVTRSLNRLHLSSDVDSSNIVKQAECRRSARILQVGAEVLTAVQFWLCLLFVYCSN